MKEPDRVPGRTAEFDPQAARERCKAASEGPWVNAHGEFVSQADTFIAICRVNRPVLEDIVAGKSVLAPRGAEQANKDFIAHARTDLPAALEALEEAQGKLEAVQRLGADYFHGGIGGVAYELARILSPERKEGE